MVFIGAVTGLYVTTKVQNVRKGLTQNCGKKGSNERKKIIEEEDAKALAEAQGGKSAPSGLKSKKKKSSPAQLEATQCSPAKAKLVGDKWEIIPAASQKFSVPAMPKSSGASRGRTSAKTSRNLSSKLRSSSSLPLLGLYQKMKWPANPRQKPLLTKNGKTFVPMG